MAKRELDFADLEAVDAAAAELVAEHPDIDLLIACAGLDRAQSLLAFDWRQARDDFTVNSLPTWCCSRIWRRRWPAAAADT